MKKALAATVLVALVLTGCNTIRGIGQDVSKVGDAVATTAEKTKNQM